MFRHYQVTRDLESQSWSEAPSLIDFSKEEGPVFEDRYAQWTRQYLELSPQTQPLSTRPREKWLQSRDESRITDDGRSRVVRWSTPSSVASVEVRSGDYVSDHRINMERAAVSRFSPAGNQIQDSTTACSQQAAKQWKLCLPRPDLPKFLRISSPTSSSTRESGTSLDNMVAEASASSSPPCLRRPDQHRSSVVCPTFSMDLGQLVTDLDVGEQRGRLSGMTPQTKPQNGEVVFTDSSSTRGRKKLRRMLAASSTTASECEDTSASPELTLPYNGNAQTVPTGTPHPPKTSGKSPPGGEEKHLILQAATALLMLLTNEPTPSSAAARPPGLSSPSNADLLSDIDESERRGSACSQASGDAATGSILPRPCTKRRYRLMSDLMAETSRL
ncbi:uncharacterized protein [Physcomitrium patens]|uniref:Uncharacterized protein n=1 Tax=Physcomitrium patens TaxID=3218 RepID=A0A2K1KNX1_PHYPA|nr:uncharacterized protein LOC112280788 [Physcomitrium patens]PNR55479.1 hypothetical protein PHYPA_006376 [Physcomitrium patens]|eukprot:XP_024372389.1 uncharacterized protein LOC112280788 [Physcomitrella patens]